MSIAERGVDGCKLEGVGGGERVRRRGMREVCGERDVSISCKRTRTR